MKNMFLFIFYALLTGIYVIGTLPYTSNKDSWHRIVFNEFFVFGILGILGLLALILQLLR